MGKENPITPAGYQESCTIQDEPGRDWCDQVYVRCGGCRLGKLSTLKTLKKVISPGDKRIKQSKPPAGDQG